MREALAVALCVLQGGAVAARPAAGAPPALVRQLSQFVVERLPATVTSVGDRARLSEKERVRFFNRDFATMVFSRAVGVDEDFFESPGPGGVQVGTIAVRFGSCRDLGRAKIAVARSGRRTFLLPVFTEFRTVARSKTLIFALSETPTEAHVARLFGELQGFDPEEAGCADGP